EHGKLVWAIGPDIAERAKEGLYLGAPLPLDKKLHVLNEQKGDLRLLTMNPANRMPGRPPAVEKTLSVLKLLPGDEASSQLLRRTQPLHLASTDDLLVCPTHAGILVGVDRAKMEVRWTYRYRDAKVPTPNLPHWQGASPVVADKSVVFTA